MHLHARVPGNYDWPPLACEEKGNGLLPTIRSSTQQPTPRLSADGGKDKPRKEEYIQSQSKHCMIARLVGEQSKS